MLLSYRCYVTLTCVPTVLWLPSQVLITGAAKVLVITGLAGGSSMHTETHIGRVMGDG